MKAVFYLYIFLLSNFSLAQINVTSNPDEYVGQLIVQSKESREKNRKKSWSYLQEAMKFEKEVSDTTLRKLYHESGLMNKDRESLYLALSFFYKELELQNQIDPKESFFVLHNIGGCYYLLGDKKKAREFWEKALAQFLKYSKSINTKEQNLKASIIYNNLAVLESDDGNYARALEMLKEFKQNNEKYKDTINLILAYENLADVYVKLDEPKTALTNLWKGDFLAKKVKSLYDRASLHHKLGEIYLEKNPIKDSANYYLNSAYNLSVDHGFIDVQLNAAEKLVKFYEKENQYQKALYYLHKAKTLSENAISNENEKKVNRLEFEFQEKQNQNELILNQKKRERFFIFGLAFLLFASVIIFLMFKLQKSKTQKRIAENQLLAKELEEKNKELTNNAMQMLQTNEILESTHKDLKELKSNTNLDANDKLLTRIITDLKLGTQAFNKNEFEKVFMETDGDFYKRLLTDFPNLTKNEIRLCAFLRMNLSSKEISAITQQSPHSIVVARSRLRKKLGLSENESINNFLIQF
ncbi:tetratricopeptide repeat protein [Empedobacter stercoris]|uniref:tetratricopeptide repeat protein n=1 Tax=Empedobacter stercoris TaxID=1628248 RepID=UPI00166285CA|nr:tetratricopeptide repeat protein [Empedobacter stercoris]MCA4810369.1 tetratricopeptide repeat protein [Empedobacter stercoris]QNT13567.1 tetratricopeptide repeat protein [Empedobacter stercoris]